MFRFVLAGLLVALVMVPALAQDEEAPQANKEQAQKDALAIQELYKQHAEAFREVTGGVTVHETNVEGTLKLCEQELGRLQKLEETALPALEPVLARVIVLWAKPGAEEEARAQEGFDAAEFAFQQSGDIEWSMKMAAANNDVAAARDLPEEFEGVGTRFSNLARMLNSVRKTRVANAAYLADYVKNQPEITFFVQDKRVPIMREWQTVLQWSQRFDPANEYANARLATIGGEIAALEQAVEKEIDEKQWAGHVEEFPGPGAVAGLAKAGVEYLRKDEGWKAEEVLAVAVRGPWQVAEKDVFGRVVSWRLPVHVAVTKPDLRAKNVARVYELSLVTVQGTPGKVEKAPPFDGYWVGDSWMMRLNKVPQ